MLVHDCNAKTNFFSPSNDDALASSFSRTRALRNDKIAPAACSLVISENSTLCMIRINSATADMSDGAVALLLNDKAEALAAAVSPPSGRVAIREALTS